jgi:hypothetical protein
LVSNAEADLQILDAGYHFLVEHRARHQPLAAERRDICAADRAA